MRVISHMRVLRGPLSLREVQDLTHVPPARLSEFENGRRFPTDQEAERITVVYGQPAGWWNPDVLLALQLDKTGDAS